MAVSPQVRQQGFFLEKEAKTLATWRTRPSQTYGVEGQSFLVLFFKKEPLP
jgi:hypothetical protein